MSKVSNVCFLLTIIVVSGNARAETVSNLVNSRWSTSTGCEIVEFNRCSEASDKICGKVVEVRASVENVGLDPIDPRTRSSLAGAVLVTDLSPIANENREACQIDDRWQWSGQYYSWQSREETTIFMQPVRDESGKLSQLKIKTCTNRMRDRRTGCNIDRRLRSYERFFARLVARRVRYCTGGTPAPVTATCVETPAWKRVNSNER